MESLTQLAYRCSVCNDIFDRDDLYHCRYCDHHYIAGTNEVPCSNCHHPARKRSDMKPAGYSVGEWIANQERQSP